MVALLFLVLLMFVLLQASRQKLLGSDLGPAHLAAGTQLQRRCGWG